MPPWALLLSVVAHGVTAGPLAARYGRTSALGDVPEMAPAREQRIRRRALTSRGSHSGDTVDPGGEQT